MVHNTGLQPRFRCGELVISSGVRALMRERQLNAKPYFLRHLRGDWGDLDGTEWSSNAKYLNP